MAMVLASLNSIVANMFTVFVRMKVNLTERLPKHLRILSLTTTTDPPHPTPTLSEPREASRGHIRRGSFEHQTKPSHIDYGVLSAVPKRVIR